MQCCLLTLTYLERRTELTKEYALYLSYNRWLHGEPLDVSEYIAVADATDYDPADLEERWNDGDYPEGDQIIGLND